MQRQTHQGHPLTAAFLSHDPVLVFQTASYGTLYAAAEAANGNGIRRKM